MQGDGTLTLVTKDGVSVRQPVYVKPWCDEAGCTYDVTLTD